MALPREKEHLEYLAYVERHSLGEEEGTLLKKEEWRKRQEADSGPAEILYPKTKKP